MSAAQLLKAACRQRTNVAISRGKLKRGDCMVSGCNSGEKIEAHHKDYSKPLEVMWLCRGHHVMVTRGLLQL